jgi:hypothetical protein
MYKGVPFMTEISDVSKLLGDLGIPIPTQIDPGRFAITCSRYCADTLLAAGNGVFVLEELVDSVTLTLGLDDIPAAREVIDQELIDLGDEHGAIASSLKALIGHLDRVQAGLVR